MSAGARELCLIESRAIVMHGERDEIVFADQLDLHMGSVGVAGDVAQAFLHDTVEADRQFCGECRRGVSMDIRNLASGAG